ncbi:ParA family protein [Euzebya tangerina]|uniref:ParA family protein n=1 Tax=Euzebya tangerina TaxID=591198 RepID=UPI000E30D780|nr:ParA family protein [Euzebya tangerina]
MSAVVYAVANQKGGVAKTTTTASLAAALRARGLDVLVVDLDPQACLTFSLGYDPDELAPTLHDVVTGRESLKATVLSHAECDIAPANLDLSGAEVALLSRTGREYVLRAQIDDLREDYDVIFIDCPPSLGVLTLNGLTAADKVIIPVQCETLSHRGVSQLLETIADVQHLTNRNLEVAGIVATMYDGRTNHAKEVLEDVQSRYDLPVIGVPVRKSVRFAEAPNQGKTILTHAPKVPGAAAYRVIAAELHGLSVPSDDLELAS